MSQCYLIKGAYQHPDVKIGWAPYITTCKTQVRSNPGGGTLLKSVIRGAGIGYQSVRNPDGLRNPALRDPVAVNGKQYVWIYTRAGTITGWIALDDITYDHGATNKPPLLGPGGYDFEVGRMVPRPKKGSPCGRPSLTRPIREISARETYLRYSPRGTAFHYLHKGDHVRLILVDAKGFAFCEVTKCVPGSAIRVGSRGWVMQEAWA